MGDLHAGTMAWLEPKLGQLTREDADGDGSGPRAHTALSSELAGHVDGLVRELSPRVVTPFNKLAAAVVAQNTRAMRAIGIDVRGQIGPTLAIIQERNQRLITKAGRDFASDIAKVIDDPANWGKRHEDLAKLLHERASVSLSRAELIARDQASKTAGQINEHRQRNAGVTTYTWSGSLDERERDTHLANEGKDFRWDDPPSETGHPTEDVNCRCVAIPVIDMGDDEEAAAPEAEGEGEGETGGGEGEGPGAGAGAGEGSGGGGDEPPDDPELPEDEPEEPRRPIVEGVHAGVVDVRSGADRELAQHALATQPQAVLDMLKKLPVDRLEVVHSKRDALGRWDGRKGTEIRINTKTDPLERLSRHPDATVTTKLALRAADAAGAGREAAAQRAQVQATMTHEAGHHLQLGGTDRALQRQIDTLVRDTHRAAIADGSAARLSVHAARPDPAEFFAEAFTAYHHAPELLNEAARVMVERVSWLRSGGHR